MNIMDCTVYMQIYRQTHVCEQDSVDLFSMLLFIKLTSFVLFIIFYVCVRYMGLYLYGM